MKTVERLNIDNPEHAGFMYDLAVECKDDFLNDHDSDIILMMNEYQRRIKSETVFAFIAKDGDRKEGIVWVDVDNYGVGRIRAGLTNSSRKGHTAMYFLRLFIAFCFDRLDLRKLDAEIVLYGRENKSSQAAEKLLRRFGFKKEGLIKEALLKDGTPRDTLLFGLTQNRYRGLRHVKK